MSFSWITPKIMTCEYYEWNKIKIKALLECPKSVEKNMVNVPFFKWVTAIWNMFINGQKLVFLE